MIRRLMDWLASRQRAADRREEIRVWLLRIAKEWNYEKD